MRTKLALIRLLCYVSLLLTFSIASAQIQIGKLTLRAQRATLPFGPVDRFGPGQMAGALRSVGFLRATGGVAFGAVAKAADGSAHTFSFTYDGKKVKAIIDENAYTLPIPDWILVPAVEIAKSNDIALITAFGEYEGNPASWDEKCRNFIFNYHKALKNRLIGLRVWQADSIGMIQENYAYLPRTKDGRRILGATEKAPSRKELSAQIEHQKIIVQKLIDLDEAYESYILIDNEVTFKIVDTQLILDGSPTYQLWKEIDGHPEFLTSEDNPLFDPKQIEASNPIVYRAVTALSQATALFRYVRYNHPSAWTELKAIANRIGPLPFVPTPTEVPKSPEIQEICQAFKDLKKSR